MMTTGDKRNALKKLQIATKVIKYSTIDFKEISVGSPKEYLKLYHYLIVDYNPAIAMEILNKYQIELQGKNDKSFIDSIYKLMRDMLNYKPPITKEQFFSIGYAEIKALMACEVINLIQQKFKSNQPATMATTGVNSKQQPSTSAASRLNENHHRVATVAATRPATTSTILSNRTPLVHNHRILNVNLPTNIKPSFSSDDIHKNFVIGNMHGFRSDENAIKKNTILEVLTNDSDCQSEAETVIESVRSERVDDERYEHLLNELNSLRESVRGTNSEEKCVKIPLRDYENLVSRVTLMENKLLIVEQQNQQLLQLLHDKKPTRVSINAAAPIKKAPSNTELVLDDYDENNEDVYETPFMSFMNNSDADVTLDATPKSKHQQQQQPRVSLVTKGLLAQGILDESSNSQNNDLTPTVDSDVINRARTLEKKALALAEATKKTNY